MYLVNVYSKTQNLYPNCQVRELQKRERAWFVLAQYGSSNPVVEARVSSAVPSINSKTVSQLEVAPPHALLYNVFFFHNTMNRNSCIRFKYGYCSSFEILHNNNLHSFFWKLEYESSVYISLGSYKVFVLSGPRRSASHPSPDIINDSDVVAAVIMILQKLQTAQRALFSVSVHLTLLSQLYFDTHWPLMYSPRFNWYFTYFAY